MLKAVERICCAEADASAAPRPPTFTTLSSYPLTDNDHAATARVAAAFREQLGDAAMEGPPAAASEDFSVFGRTWGVPYVFWFVGGTDPTVYARAKAEGVVHTLPSNHSPRFAPVLDPTLRVGLQAMLAGRRRGCALREVAHRPRARRAAGPTASRSAERSRRPGQMPRA